MGELPVRCDLPVTSHDIVIQVIVHGLAIATASFWCSGLSWVWICLISQFSLSKILQELQPLWIEGLIDSKSVIPWLIFSVSSWELHRLSQTEYFYISHINTHIYILWLPLPQTKDWVSLAVLPQPQAMARHRDSPCFCYKSHFFNGDFLGRAFGLPEAVWMNFNRNIQWVLINVFLLAICKQSPNPHRTISIPSAEKPASLTAADNQKKHFGLWLQQINGQEHPRVRSSWDK